jgi:hypothetical protein
MKNKKEKIEKKLMYIQFCNCKPKNHKPHRIVEKNPILGEIEKCFYILEDEKLKRS